MKKSLDVTLTSLNGHDAAGLVEYLKVLDAVDLRTVAKYVNDLRRVVDAKKTRTMKAMLKPGHKVNVIKGGKVIATGVIDRVKTKKAIVKNFKYISEHGLESMTGSTYDVPLSMLKVA